MADEFLVSGNSCCSLDQDNGGGYQSTSSYKFLSGIDLGASYGSYLLPSQSGRRQLPQAGFTHAGKNKQSSSVPRLPPLAAGRGLVSLRPVSEVQDDASSVLSSSFGWSRSGGLPAMTTKAPQPLSGAPSLTSLCKDLHQLIKSLVDYKDHLLHRDADGSALESLCNTLLPAHRELEGVVRRLTGGGKQAKSDSGMSIETLQLIMVYMQLILQALTEQNKQLMGKTKSPSISKDRVESTALLANNKETLLYMHVQEAELSTLRKLYKATQAELAGTRNRCNKLTQKLSEADEKSRMTTSELSAQLQIARKLLVETSNALKEERLKLQEANLQANRRKQEMLQARRTQPHKKAIECQLNKLRNRLEEQNEVEKQLRRQLQSNNVRIKQLMSQVKEKTRPTQSIRLPPAKPKLQSRRVQNNLRGTRRPDKHSASTKSPYNTVFKQPVGVVIHVTHKPSQSRGPPFHPTHASRHPLSITSMQQNNAHSNLPPPPTIHSSADELCSLAQFPDKQTAAKTLRLLGLL